MSTYFLILNGVQKGRYSAAQIKAMYEAGTVTADTLYWTEELYEWKPVDHLFQKQTVEKAAATPPPLVTSAIQSNDRTSAERNDLMACPSCHKPVSRNAESCPICGHPLKSGGLMGKPGSAGRVLNVVFLIIVLIAIVYFLS